MIWGLDMCCQSTSGVIWSLLSSGCTVMRMEIRNVQLQNPVNGELHGCGYWCVQLLCRVGGSGTRRRAGRALECGLLKAVAVGRQQRTQGMDCPMEARKLPNFNGARAQEHRRAPVRCACKPRANKKGQLELDGRLLQHASGTPLLPFTTTSKRSLSGHLAQTQTTHIRTRFWEGSAPGVPLIMRQAIIYGDVPR